MFYVRDFVITSRATALLHGALAILPLYCGEFLLYTICGVFSPAASLFGSSGGAGALCALAGLQLSSHFILFNVQLVAVVFFFTITTLFILAANKWRCREVLALFMIILILVFCFGLAIQAFYLFLY